MRFVLGNVSPVEQAARFYISILRGESMYNINDSVQYSSQGVCRITDITSRKINGQSIEYYVLNPFYDEKSTIFVPVHNENLTRKMRRIMSAEEIHELIKAMPDEKTMWIDDRNIRRESYRKILLDGNRRNLVKMIKALHIQQEKLKAQGKRLSTSDEVFLKEAEKILHDELALVLNIERDQVLPFIMSRIDVKEKT